MYCPICNGSGFVDRCPKCFTEIISDGGEHWDFEGCPKCKDEDQVNYTEYISTPCMHCDNGTISADEFDNMYPNNDEYENSYNSTNYQKKSGCFTFLSLYFIILLMFIIAYYNY